MLHLANLQPAEGPSCALGSIGVPSDWCLTCLSWEWPVSCICLLACAGQWEGGKSGLSALSFRKEECGRNRYLSLLLSFCGLLGVQMKIIFDS